MERKVIQLDSVTRKSKKKFAKTIALKTKKACSFELQKKLKTVENDIRISIDVALMNIPKISEYPIYPIVNSEDLRIDGIDIVKLFIINLTYQQRIVAFPQIDEEDFNELKEELAKLEIPEKLKIAIRNLIQHAFINQS